MVKAHKCGQMEHATMEVGMRIKYKAMANLYTPTKMNTKENSMPTGRMVLEDMFRSVVKRMKVSGQMINLTGKGN